MWRDCNQGGERLNRARVQVDTGVFQALSRPRMLVCVQLGHGSECWREMQVRQGGKDKGHDAEVERSRVWAGGPTPGAKPERARRAGATRAGEQV